MSFVRKTFILFILAAALFLPAGFLQACSKSPAVPSFPGAEGFGAATPGGRFGKVVFVTHLDDTTDKNSSAYPGSLRWALEHTWEDDPADPYDQRRFIVFNVGGVIHLVDKLIVRNPFVTIAGQSAPGDGIMLSGEEFAIATHDVIVRGLRVRVGDEGAPTCCRDAISISTYYGDGDVYNVIVDHSSFGWAVDENMSIWADPTDDSSIYNISIQWNIISEGLNDSIHIDEEAVSPAPHSMGLIIGDKGSNMTIHHNLFAHNWGRNPHISGVDGLEVANNVMYGWGDGAFEFGSYATRVHALNNYFKPNAASRPFEIFAHEPMPADTRAYLSGNVVDDPQSGASLVDARIYNPDNFLFSSIPLFKSSKVDVVSAEDAYTAVLNSAGAIAPVRDEVDARVVRDVLNREGQMIDSQNQVGGWQDFQGGQSPQDDDGDGVPNEWEASHGLDPNNADDANHPNKLAPSGYAWIEEYVNSLIPLPTQ